VITNRPLFLLLLATTLNACGGGEPSQGDDDDSSQPIDRGPTILAVDGDPNGLWWDAASGTLYLADDNGNRVLQWTDGAGFSLLADLPSTTADSPGLGQLVLDSVGNLVVTRFGGGSAGDVVYVKPDGSTAVVPNLDPTRRRLGLTLGADGTLYDSWFIKNDTGRVGSVGILDLAGSDAEFATGFQKPVGALVQGTTLYVSDQDLGAVLKLELSTPQSHQNFAVVDGPDLLAAGPNSSLFTGGTDGTVRQIDSTGAVTTFATGFQQARGVAYDAENRRLFVADHDVADSNGSTNFLQILPVNE
jgi:hypothetical protein